MPPTRTTQPVSGGCHVTMTLVGADGKPSPLTVRIKPRIAKVYEGTYYTADERVIPTPAGKLDVVLPPGAYTITVGTMTYRDVIVPDEPHANLADLLKGTIRG